VIGKSCYQKCEKKPVLWSDLSTNLTDSSIAILAIGMARDFGELLPRVRKSAFLTAPIFFDDSHRGHISLLLFWP
jgi:hypothetical protein